MWYRGVQGFATLLRRQASASPCLDNRGDKNSEWKKLPRLYALAQDEIEKISPNIIFSKIHVQTIHWYRYKLTNFFENIASCTKSLWQKPARENVTIDEDIRDRLERVVWKISRCSLDRKKKKHNTDRTYSSPRGWNHVYLVEDTPWISSDHYSTIVLKGSRGIHV